MVGLAGSTFQFLTGAVISIAALSSPGFLEPAGFVVGGGAKVYVLLFGAIFCLGGLGSGFSLFRYFRDAKRADDIVLAETIEQQSSEVTEASSEDVSSDDG